MKITNPTNSEISIQFKGVVYTIPARGSISQVSDDVATYWKTMIHEFIIVEADSATSVTEPVKAEQNIEEEAEKPVRKIKK